MFSNLLFAVILIHILAGLISLSAGATALAAPKGGRLHRRAGRVFVAAMLVMTGIATVVATFWSPVRINVVAGLVTFYLVLTAVLTVRRPAAHARAIDVGAMLVAVAAGIVGIVFGIEARGTPRGVLDGIPYAAYFVFGAVALLASALDLRMIVAGGVHGKHRIARHLWRMCFAMFVATGSFFLGQARFLPDAVRHPALLAIPVLAVLVLMLYWLVRVLFTQWSARRASPGASSRSGATRPSPYAPLGMSHGPGME